MCCGMLASCAISCCSACACKVCCRFGNAQSTGVKLLYAFLLLFTSLLSLAMLGTGMQSWLNEQLSSFWFTGPAEGELMRDELVGTLAVTRIMTATVVFHLLLAPLVCGISNTKNPRAALHNGLWPAKILGLIGLIVLMFFLPNELFVGLSSTLYRVGGGLYILIQLILFLGCVYNFYEYIFINKGETQGWMCVVVVLTLLAYLWVGFVVVATIVIHSGGDGCAEGLVGGLVGLLACIVVSALSVSGFVRNAENNHQAQTSGVFQAAMVSAYCSYLVLSAIINHPETRCRPVDDAYDATLRLVGCVFVFAAVAYSAVRGGSDSEGWKVGAGRGVPARAAVGDVGGEEDGKGVVDDEVEMTRYNYSIFHIMMSLAAMYVAMMLTGWHTMEGTDDNLVLDRSLASVWIKICASWVCYALYTFTMILPPLCPGREFGNEPPAADAGAGAAP